MTLKLQVAPLALSNYVSKCLSVHFPYFPPSLSLTPLHQTYKTEAREWGRGIVVSAWGPESWSQHPCCECGSFPRKLQMEETDRKIPLCQRSKLDDDQTGHPAIPVWLPWAHVCALKHTHTTHTLFLSTTMHLNNPFLQSLLDEPSLHLLMATSAFYLLDSSHLTLIFFEQFLSFPRLKDH